MCGIVGGVAKRNLIPIMLEGLARLEYRGYDSVGVAVVNQDNHLQRQRVTGRVKELVELCAKDTIKGNVGIGHTRWATHGGVSVDNAHPHFSNDTLSIVHNGIIENYADLKDELITLGYKFESQTDTEVMLHLIYHHYTKSNDLLMAVKQTIKRLHGAYAIGVINKNNPNEVVCARLGSPLVLGIGINETFFASDISALLPVTQQVIYLEDGDVVKIERTTWTIFDKNDDVVKRKVNLSTQSINQTDLGIYHHYMQKEIFEQPEAIADTLQKLGNSFTAQLFGNNALEIFSQIKRIQIIACGTSYNAGMVAKYWFEDITGIECNVDIASEYRYRKIVPDNNILVINISQSGETADTLACIKYVHELGMLNTLSISNVPESSLVRLSKLHILTQAGPEIGVASTKAFTTQLVVLLYLAYTLAKVKNKLSKADEEKAINELRKLPQLIIDVLALENKLKAIAKEFEHKQHALFLGRNTLYPIAVEGALKLKEISYIHAESYAAGELKHGPLALIDKEMPVLVMLPGNILADKIKSNIQEVLARQGTIYLFTDIVNDDINNNCHKIITMPTQNLSEYLLPIIYTVPLQLLAYHTAIIKGTDVDKPRNLAKSVTVE